MTPPITAVIVNFNSGHELRHALQSLADQGRADWEAIVVDNASSDGSESVVGDFAPHARLIRNRENRGFGAGVNQGLAAARAPLVLIMNPDCRLLAGALETMRRELEAHQSCGIVGPRILDPDGGVQGSARGDPDMWTGLFGRTSRLRRALPDLAVSKRNVMGGAEDRGSSVVVDWVSGACLLAQREVLASVGGFDERYFLYWEDADLCRRLRARGYDVRYVPAATAVHRVGQSSQTARAASIRAFHDSAYLYYATHVARGALNPKRALARVILALRCRWKLRAARQEDAASPAYTEL
jgi:GT2 family glycosyltransferase